MEAILIYLLKSAGVLAIFFFSYQFFLKKETFFRMNRHYLLAGILGSLLLPLVIFTNYVYVEPVIETFNPNLFLTDIPFTNNAVEQNKPFNWLLFGTYVYLAGVLIFGMNFVIQLISLFNLFKNNTKKREDGFYFVELNSNISPFSFFNYIVYNPKKYNRNDLEIIINHEKAHGNQFHSIDILLSQLFVILQWFNPVSWFYKKSIQQNLEFMADQFAITKVESAKQYQHTLLKASLKPQYASITNNFYNSLIKKRIIMLNQAKSNIKNVWKYSVVLPALAFFLMSFNVETIEVEKPIKDLPTSTDLSFIIENNEFYKTNSVDKNKTQAKVFFKGNSTSMLNFTQKIIKKKIHKNTTDQELKEISQSLKKDGIEFNFKNVKRNDNNEIIGINITYKDSNGNTGNYALNSDNPINTFHFYKEENGSIGFKSENATSFQRKKLVEVRELDKAKREEIMKAREMQRDQMKKEREYMVQERKEMMEKHKAMSKERRKEIEIHVEKAREEHKKALEEHENQRKIIIKERLKLHDSLKDKHGNIFIIDKNDHHEDEIFYKGKTQALFIVDGEERDGKTIELISPKDIAHVNVLKGEHAIKLYGSKGKDGVIVIKTKPHGVNDFTFEFNEEFVEPGYAVKVSPKMEKKWVSKFNTLEINTIDKNTTDTELKSLKSELKSNNIDFSYGKVKRNKSGEIIRIKISLDDNKGDKTSATFNHTNKNIPNIIFGRSNNNLFIKSN
ncbi:MAG: hypothetical protein HKO81_08900 [Flavobacteriaceae bacterium]|nr:hypothetical protein [Flavobacteriaceae bacterium]